VTVAGLAFLVRKCQYLSTFHLQIDGRLIGLPLEDNACGLRPNLRMQSISLGHSPIEDVTEVATVFARALPNLRRIDVIADQSVYTNRWKQVTALVREIREQEDGLGLGGVDRRHIT
jgi:hypothetical protein